MLVSIAGPPAHAAPTPPPSVPGATPSAAQLSAAAQALPFPVTTGLTSDGLGVWIYARSTRARDRLGTRAFAAFVGFLFAAYAANLGPPPPSVAAIVGVGMAGGAVLLLWAWWFDRHRNPVT